LKPVNFNITAVTAVLIIIFSFVSLSGCNEGGSGSLGSSNVGDYHGQNPGGNSGSFRENSIQGPQNIDIEKYSLEITGLVIEPKTYTYDQILTQYKHYTKNVTLNCVEGWSVDATWEGILIRDILNSSGVKDTAKIIIFYAYDGYSTSFPIDYVMKNDIIMAYKLNNETLPPERGYPFELVAESKWGYKWIKWITKIELSDNINYKGYWENYGYSNNGDLDESFREK
jgi:DMSO/TMAO reductase YedYZ molybdopterin-dependent catalytic subunit